MIRQYSYGDVTWYDLESPKENEIEKLSAVYKLSPLIQEELLTPTLKPKADVYDNYLYVILHFPVIRPSLRDSNREIDFVIGKKFIITTHYESVDPLHKFVDIFSIKHLSPRQAKEIHAGHIFFHMMKHLYDSMIVELDILGRILGKAEKNLFAGKEKGMLIALSKINRDLLDFKVSTNLHKSILESFEKESIGFFGKDFESFSKDMINEYLKIHLSIQENKDFLEELRRTNDSLLSNKQNEIMKTVTVLAFIFLPLSLLASIFGMNVDNIPITNLPHAFGIITGGMLGLAVIIILIARYNEWL